MRLFCQAYSSHNRPEWHCSLQNGWHLSLMLTGFLCYSQTWTTSHIFRTVYRPRIWVFVLVFKRLNIFSFSFACLPFSFSFFLKKGRCLHKIKACFAKFSFFLLFCNVELLCSKRPEVQPESLSPKQPGDEEGYKLQQLNPLLLLFQAALWFVHANYMSGIQGK